MYQYDRNVLAKVYILYKQRTAMNTQKGNKGISLSAYSQTLGDMQKTFHTRDVERKMREDHFIAPMWMSPEELKKKKATQH